MLEFIPQGSDKVELTHSVLSSGTQVAVANPSDPTNIGLVLVPDVYGLRPLVDDTISQLASVGIATIAVEPFSHMSDNPSELTRDEKFARMKDLDDTMQCADILAAGQILRTQHNCARVCLIGFCIGGMYAFKCAGTGEFDSVISCYGMITIPQEWKGPGQREPLDYLQMQSVSPVTAIIGGKDHGYAKSDDVKKLRTVLENSQHKELGSEIVEYAEAGHAFMHDPNRGEHRPADALRAWQHALDVITRH